jgi:alpha-beta hydrolase superfamily lysophospholipase
MQKKAFTLPCTDGHQMPVYKWLPGESPEYVLHIAHGMSEYAERYGPVAELLTQQGIAVYAHDQRAHGKATAKLNDQGLGEDNWFYKQVDDIHVMMQYLKKTYPQQKIFLLGHSMGSFLCQRYFQLYGNEIDGVLLSASNGKRDPMMGLGIGVAWAQMKLFGPQYRSKLIDTLSFGKFNSYFKPNRTKADWLSRDKKVVDIYVSDPQCGFKCSALFFYYFFKGIGDCFNKENIRQLPTTIPVLVFSGDKDPVGLFGKGVLELVDNWKAAGVKDISYKLYPGGRHEMLNEINRAEVLQDLVNWMKGHL